MGHAGEYGTPRRIEIQRETVVVRSAADICRPQQGGAVGGQFRHVVGVTQGCHPLGEPLRVTRAHENLILELDERPAYQALIDRAPGGLTQDLEWALNFLFVGLIPEPIPGELRPGEYLVRNIVTADPDTGVLAVSASVEEGQSIIFAQREAASAHDDLLRMLDLLHHFALHAVLLVNKWDLNPQATEAIERTARERGVRPCGRVPFDGRVAMALAQGRTPLVVPPVRRALKKAWNEIACALAEMAEGGSDAA